MSASDTPDRRRHARGRAPGVVATALTGSGEAITCSVQDLSAGGARLLMTQTLAPDSHLQVRLEINASRPLVLAARVNRVETLDGHGTLVAVEFVAAPDVVENAIQRVVLRALERQRAHGRQTVLVIDDEPEVRIALARDLDTLGLHVISVATPYDAIRALKDETTRVDLALIDLGLGEADGLDLVAYLARDYPEVRRIVMSGHRMGELEDEVAAGRAHALLRKPWQRSSLSRAAGTADPDR